MMDHFIEKNHSAGYAAGYNFVSKYENIVMEELCFHVVYFIVWVIYITFARQDSYSA